MKIQNATLSPLFLAALLTTAACSGGDDDDQAAGPNAWVGHTYLLEIPPSHWAQPKNVGGDIGLFVPQFVIQVEAEAEGNLDMLIGTASAGVQEPCNPTVAVTVPSDYPEVQIGPFDFPMYIKHTTEPVAVNATVYNLTITDVLPNGDAVAEEGELLATLDTRDVAPMFTQLGDNPTADAVCTALADFEASCEACPSDSQEYCQTLRAVRLGATESDPIEPIDAASVPASCTE